MTRQKKSEERKKITTTALMELTEQETLNKLDRIMNGELGEVIDALVIADQTAKLAELNK